MNKWFARIAFATGLVTIGVTGYVAGRDGLDLNTILWFGLGAAMTVAYSRLS